MRMDAGGSSVCHWPHNETREIHMIFGRNVLRVVLSSFLSLAACATVDDGQPEPAAPDRAQALSELRLEAGASVAMQVGETGATRVLAMAPRFAVPGHAIDPAAAAVRFLQDHREVFQLDAREAASFTVTRVDRDPQSDVRHVTLQRVVDGDPVFQGAITV